MPARGPQQAMPQRFVSAHAREVTSLEEPIQTYPQTNSSETGSQAAEEDFPLDELLEEDEPFDEDFEPESEPEEPEPDEPEPEPDAAAADVFAPDSEDFDATVEVLVVLRLSLR